MTTPADNDDIRKTQAIWQSQGLTATDVWNAMGLRFAWAVTWPEVRAYMTQFYPIPDRPFLNLAPPSRTKAPAPQSPKPAPSGRR